MGLLDELLENWYLKKIARDPKEYFSLINENKIDSNNQTFFDAYVSSFQKTFHTFDSDILDQLIIHNIPIDVIKNNHFCLNVIYSLIDESINRSFIYENHFDLLNQLIDDQKILTYLQNKYDFQKLGQEFLHSLPNILIGEVDKNHYQSYIMLLQKCGFVPFQDENLIKNYSFTQVENMSKIGVLSDNVESTLYRSRFETLKKQYKDGNPIFEQKLIDNKNETLDEFASYWHDIDQKLGQDSLSFVFNILQRLNISHMKDIFNEYTDDELYEMNKDEYSRDYFNQYLDDIKSSLFTTEGKLSSNFFDDQKINSPAYYVSMYNFEGRERNYNLVDNILHVFAVNKDQLKGNMLGLVKVWESLDNENSKKVFLKYVTGGHHYEYGKMLDENGITPNFYKGILEDSDSQDIIDALHIDIEKYFNKAEQKYLALNYNGLIREILLAHPDSYLYSNLVNKYFANGEIQKSFIELILLSNILRFDELKKTPEIFNLLSNGEKKYLEMLEKYYSFEILKRIPIYEINTFFDEKGMTPKCINFLFENQEYEIIIKEKNDLASLDDTKTKILEEFQKIPEHLRDLFKSYLKEQNGNFDVNRINGIANILMEIAYSNATELSNHAFEIASLIIKSYTPEENLQRIENIFVKNNLPFVAKLFLTFNILHPDDKLLDDYFANFNMISPVLKNYSYSVDRLKTIIFSDLLKCAIGSNNHSLIEYINIIEKGNELFTLLKNNQINFEYLSLEDQKVLQVFLEHLKTLYYTSSKSHNKTVRFSGNLLEDLEKLENLFETNDRYNLPDRIVRTFGYFAGVKSFNELKQLINNIRENADARNRIKAKEPFSLRKGDFVKGIRNIGYLHNILQNGSIAADFLGASANTDATPLDTDLSCILANGKTIPETLEDTLARDFGPIWIVLKSTNSFNVTRDEMGNHYDHIKDFSSIEVFKTSGNGHYGIRTGFPSSMIDYIIVQNEDPRVYVDIVTNGFYIPVIDYKTGKLLFTPEYYDYLKSKMMGLSYYGYNDYHFSDNLETEEINEINNQLNENVKITNIQKQKVYQVIKSAIKSIGLGFKDKMTGDVSDGFVELIDTGSSGRNTNLINDYDYDFMMRIDGDILKDPKRFQLLKNTIIRALHSKGESTAFGDLRLKDVQIEGEDNPLKVDITFMQKTNKINYSSEEALKDRLETIRKKDFNKYQLVLSNVILAKRILKEAHVYKPQKAANPEGGLGGIGVETWILQNGGSFIDAAEDFLKVANSCNTFEEFKKKYFIWDFGENHYAFNGKANYIHDNFVNNLSSEGYLKMKLVLQEYLSKEKEKQEVRS